MLTTTMEETFGQRLTRLLAQKNGGNQSELARFVGVSPQAVQQWAQDETFPRRASIQKAAEFLGVSEWVLRDGGNSEDFLKKLISSSDTLEDLREQLQLHSGLIKKHNLKQQDCFLHIANGDNMADYIVHGDMVVFDTSKTQPESGHIFLLSFPNGDVIRELRQEIRGAWILESRNPNKQKYPDERIEPDEVDLMKIKGRFVYRQG